MLRVVVLSFVLVASLPAQVPEYLYLKMNSTVSTTTADKALPGMPGAMPILVGGAGWNTGSAKIGGACYKSSTNPSNTASDALHTRAPFNLGGDWTIECWVRTDSSMQATPYGCIFGEDSLGPFRSTFGDSVVGKTAVTLEGLFGTIYLKGVLTQGVWYHIAFVHDSVELTLTPYLDGVPQEKWPLTTPIVLNGTDADGLKLGNVDVTHPWYGSIDEFRIWLHARNELEIQSNMFNQLASAVDDLAITAVTSPVYVQGSMQFATANEVVSVDIKNLGTSSVPAGTSLMMSYRVNGGVQINELVSLPATLATGDTFNFSFNASADLSQPGSQEVEVTLSWLLDGNATNDVRSRAFGGSGNEHLINEFPWREDFESGLAQGYSIGPQNWDLEPLMFGQPGFRYSNFEPTFPGLGLPTGDHTFGPGGGGYYAYGVLSFFDSSVAMRTPVLDFRGLNNPRLRFWVHSDYAAGGPSPSTMSLDIVEQPSGLTTLDVWGPVGIATGAGWSEVQVDLSAFVGKFVELRFREDTLATSGIQVNYMDDVMVYDHLIGTGQPPRPNLAVMDLNAAMSLGFNPVSSLENGPYFGNASVGASMDFSFEGPANAAIILLAGPLNPQIATYPAPIGQFDLGVSVDLATGLPTGMTVIFNGQNLFGLDQFFRTTSAGTTAISFPTPVLPSGVLTTFQAATFDPLTSAPALSNAIELSIN